MANAGTVVPNTQIKRLHAGKVMQLKFKARTFFSCKKEDTIDCKLAHDPSLSEILPISFGANADHVKLMAIYLRPTQVRHDLHLEGQGVVWLGGFNQPIIKTSSNKLRYFKAILIQCYCMLGEVSVQCRQSFRATQFGRNAIRKKPRSEAMP